ncbi:mitogen-activated protein kinase 14-like isoform X2 [Convolutriloba macropyga]|uniref:mitogen-activated protein kinase 14-like isoform X2 n=1 Tax=Convolutriloba macropyga TaxID=536237 RepID=UPI003F526407
MAGRNEDEASNFQTTNNEGTLEKQIAATSQQLLVEWTIQGKTYHIKSRFHSLELDNVGQWGPTFKATDTITKTDVAIKRMHKAFHDIELAKRALRELKMLRFVNHECLVSLFDVFTTSENADSMTHLYLVTSFSEYDLHRVIEQYDIDNQFLTPEHIQFFMYQILYGLNYLHAVNIIHFITGLGFNPKVKTDGMCSYMQMRWYRAPETILTNWESISCAVDIWAAGCILGELLLARPLFRADVLLDVIRKQIYICGSLDGQTLELYKDSKQAVQYLRNKLSGHPRVDFLDYFKASEQCTNLLEQLLQTNPSKRPSAKQTLSHPYFTDIYEPEDEASAPGHFDHTFEDISTLTDVRQAIFDEISQVSVAEILPDKNASV